MSERQAVQGEFLALLVALRDSRERTLAAQAARAPLDNPHVPVLMDALRKAGAAGQVAVLLARDPAAQKPGGLS